MKKLLIILAPTVLIFGILTCITAKFESMVDGDDTMGFPLTFYHGFGYGERVIPPPIQSETYYWKLLLDILFAAFVAVLGRAIFVKVNNRLKK